MLYGVAAGFSALAVALRLFNVYVTLAVAAMALVALAVFGVFLAEVRAARFGGENSAPVEEKPASGAWTAVPAESEGGKAEVR